MSKSKIGEIKAPEEDGIDRIYKWTAENEDGKKKCHLEKKDSKEKKGTTKNKEEKSVGSIRLVEINEEPSSDHGALVLRQAFARRREELRGKSREMSPQDAAIKIQMSFRAYLIQRSQALRALRELAIAKAKLKEIRVLFNSVSYRRFRLPQDDEERQRFSEKIIVLLLTVDAIEGADMLVRAVKKSMVDNLEAMLGVVDPLPAGRTQSTKRKTFDMPHHIIQKELAEGEAEVIWMLEEEGDGSETLETSL